MNRKILGLVLLAGVLLATPMVGIAQAWSWWCIGGESESFNVTLAVDPAFYIMNTESKYFPSETDPCLAIFKTPELMVDYTITVGDDVYTLDDFEYSGTMVSIVCKPNLAEYAGVFTPGEKATWMWLYQYDFSAVPGGLEGKIKMSAYLKWEPGVPTDSKICSLWGTGDFRCTKIDAVIDMSGGGAHVGTVTGWPV